MKKALLQTALADSKIQPAETMDRLTQKALNEGRETGREAAALWRAGDAVVAPLAQELLGQLEELALDALLQGLEPDHVPRLIWSIRAMTDIEIALRKKMIDKLLPLLDNKMPVPLPVFVGRLEESVPETRVCDEACLLLRRLVLTAESVGAYYTNLRFFCRLPESERDLEILKAKNERAFTRWIEPGE